MPESPTEIGLRVPAELRPLLRLGVVRAEPIRVMPGHARLREEIRRSCARLAELHAGRKPSEISGLAPARDLYRAFGIDPTRTRPSSEALLRRVLKGQPLPEINTAVDLGNLCAVRFLLPIGLYDAARIAGQVTLRRGAAGESYPGIRKQRVNLEGRPVLADRDGPFGNPTSDSLRTSVGERTRSLWMVIFAPGGFPTDVMAEHVRWTREAMIAWLGGPERPVRTTGGLAP